MTVSTGIWKRPRPAVLAAGLALVAVLLAPPGPTPAAESGFVPVRVEPGALAALGVEPRWLEEYEAFDWAEISAADVDRLRAAGVEVEAHPEVRILQLPSARFDPARSVPRGSGARIGDDPGLALVQFRAPIRDAWLASMRAAGARVVQPIAPFSYVVLANASALDSLRALPPVRWAGAFDPAYRFGHLEPADLAGTVNVVLVDEDIAPARADVAAIADAMRPAGAVRFADVVGRGAQVEIGAASVDELLAMPEVLMVSPQRSAKTRDELSDQIVASLPVAAGLPEPGYPGVLERHGVSGAGVVVAHVDSGVDMTHPDLASRSAGCKDYYSGGAQCANGGVDSLGHGTHTAGIVAGTAAFGGNDDDGFLYGLGMAPGAGLYVQNYVGLVAPAEPSGPGQYQELNRDSVLGGATVSANSWGPSGTPQGYDADTREFDFAPRDADLTTPQHEPLAFVLSIMNGEGDTSTQGSPDEGKNLIRVGATENARTGSTEDLSFVTAHGPALDGRRLPDIVAPGEEIISTRANNAAPVVCGEPVPDSDGAIYAPCTGTSMASPHVSGGAAVFIEHYRKRFGATPSPALIKAAFINGAVDLAGGVDADGEPLGHPPDDRQGWGRFNLENVLGGAEKSYVDQAVVLSTTGATYGATVDPVDPSQPVKVTLVWTDAPGPGLGGATPAWVNDLDLRVTTGDTTYLGNAFGNPSIGWSERGGAADFRNNVENVYLQRAAGPLTVEVRAANLPGDGVPGRGDGTDQDFALVLSNARVQQAPATCGTGVVGAGVVVGTAGPDVLTGTAGADVICGLGGKDRLRGLRGKDLLIGGGGRDELRGARGKDVLIGGPGRDDLRGGRGKDVLKGGRKRDLLVGGKGRDVLNAGPGRDRCRSGPGRDRVRGCERGR